MALLVTAALAVLSPPSEARADDARELYRQGVVLYDSGHYGAAEDKLEQALALSATHDIAVSLGQAEEKQGKLDEAADHYLAGLKALPASSSAQVLATVKRTYESAAAQVGKLVVDTAPGARLFVDDAERNKAGADGTATVHLTAGEHRLRAVAGEEEASAVVTAVVGEAGRVELVLKPNGEPSGPASATGHPHPAVWIGGSVLAAGGIGVGIALAVASGSEASEADDLLAGLQTGDLGRACALDHAACTAIDERNRSADSLTTGSIIGFAAGGAFAAATLTYVLWTSSSSGEASDDAAWGDGATAWTVLPVGQRDSAGLMITGSF